MDLPEPPVRIYGEMDRNYTENDDDCDDYVEMSRYETVVDTPRAQPTPTSRQINNNQSLALLTSTSPNNGNTSANAVEELKNRISQLEHLVISSTVNVTNNYNLSSLPSSQQHLSHHGLLYRISQLETLLAASEIDNRNLTKELNVSNAKIQELEIDKIDQLHEKSIEISDLQKTIELSSIKLAKANKKIVMMEEYINTLPSQEELDEAKRSVVYLEAHNQYQGEQLERTRAQLAHLQQNYVKIETEYTNAKRRLEELQPLKDAMNQMLNSPTSDKLDDSKLMELVTIQKAQLLRSKKIIESQRKELTSMETERGELILQLSEKSNKIQALDDANKFLQLHLESCNGKIEDLESERTKTQKEVKELKDKLDEYDRTFTLRQKEMINILRLVNELGVVIHDMELLLKCGQELSNGEEPSVDLLLGLDIEFSNPDEDCSEGISSHLDIDSEWILSKYNTVRNFRKNIKTFRSQLTNVYTDYMTTKLVKGCGIQ